MKNYEVSSIYSLNDNQFYLTIESYKIDGDKLSFSFKEKINGTYYFETKNEKENFDYSIGDLLYVSGSLSEIKSNTIFNTFDYKKYSYHKGIIYNLQIDSFNLYKKNSNILNNIKSYVYKRVESIKYNEYLYAFILGSSYYLDTSSYNNYKINGVTHLFALSGLHVSLFSGIILLILKKLKIKEFPSFIITSLFLLFFSFIASNPPSILRAVIYFILSNINKIYYFYIKPKNLLYLTLIILLFINPNYIYNTGFILSFTITYSIILFNEKYSVKNSILSILVISIISFLSSIPIIINMSYEINIIGFINNLFFIPLVTYIVFPLSLLTIIFPFLSPLLNILTNFMENISSISSSILNCTLIFSKMNYVEIIIYYVLFMLILKRKRASICLIIFFIVYLYVKPNFDSNTYVYYLDVSQGDSILIKSKDNVTVIDIGGKVEYSFNDEEWKNRNREYNTIISNVIPFYKSLGIKKIDNFIISHGDTDHMGWSNQLIDNFNVDKVIFNCGNYNYLEKNLINKLNDLDIEYSSCINKLDDFVFLNTKNYSNENDSSSVIYYEHNNIKFLFMGDAGIQKEKDILEKYNLRNIDFLKIGHHGSNTSSSEEFINSVKPKYSIISVGENNKYGHPKESVLNILEKNNSKIYRTDIDGSIEIKIESDGYSIETCEP